MALIRPLQALRYTAAAGPLAELVAPPYDVISPAERARLAAKRPAGSIHLILPQGDEPYRAAARLLADWRERHWLERDTEPAFFVLAQAFAIEGRAWERWGLLAGLELRGFDENIVLPHERTLAGPKEDRLRLIRACATNLSPIFTLVDTPLGLAELAGDSDAEAIADFHDDDGVHVRLWRLRPGPAARALADKVANQPVFIADGHHRYEISLAYRNERRAADPSVNGTLRPWDFVLTYLASTRDEGLAVLPTHRLLRGPLPADFAARLARTCHQIPMASPAALWAALEATSDATRGPRLGLLTPDGPPLLLEPGADGALQLARLAPELARLDVAFLHQVVLPGVPPEGFEYTHDALSAIAAAAAGRLALLLPPPRVNDVLDISQAGLTMPQKSTYFYPKVPTGLVFNPLEDS